MNNGWLGPETKSIRRYASNTFNGRQQLSLPAAAACSDIEDDQVMSFTKLHKARRYAAYAKEISALYEA